MAFLIVKRMTNSAFSLEKTRMVMALMMVSTP
jgi:hypothetical protein